LCSIVVLRFIFDNRIKFINAGHTSKHFNSWKIKSGTSIVRNAILFSNPQYLSYYTAVLDSVFGGLNAYSKIWFRGMTHQMNYLQCNEFKELHCVNEPLKLNPTANNYCPNFKGKKTMNKRGEPVYETNLIKELTESLKQRTTFRNVEYWFARDLQKLLGYAEWRNFSLVIDKAKTGFPKSGQEIGDQFVDVNKLIADFLPWHFGKQSSFCLFYKREKIPPLRIPKKFLRDRAQNQYSTSPECCAAASKLSVSSLMRFVFIYRLSPLISICFLPP